MNIRRTLGIAALVLFGLLVLGIGVLYAMFDGERVKKELVQVVKEQKQRTLSIPGELGLSVWPSLAITLGQASLSEPNSAQSFVSFDRARVSVAVLPLLSRQVSVSAVELAGLKATVVKHKDGSFNFSDLLESSASEQDPKTPKPTDPASAKSEPLRIDVAAIQLSGAQLLWVDEKTGSRSTVSNLDISTGRIQADTASQTYLVNKVAIAATGKSGADTFDLRLDAPSVNVAADKATGDTVKLVAKLTGDKKNVQVTLTLSGIQGSPKALNVAKVALDLDATAGEARVRGSVESPLLVNVQAQTVALDKLTGKLEVAHPSMPMKQMTLPIAGHVRADMAKSTADVALNTQFDESKVALQAGIAKFAPLALGFDLDIDQLNVDKYFPPAPAGSAGAGGGAGSGAAAAGGADPKVDISALKGLNVSGMLSIGALQVSNIKLQKLQAKLSVLGGRLSVAPMSANLYQGTLAGSLSASAADNSVALKQTLSGVNIGPLLKDVADKDMLDGKGNVVLDVQTDGATVGAMKKSLDGTASLSLKDGAIKGINLGKSFRELKAKLGGGGADSTQQANSNDKTDFSEMIASFKIANGVAHNDDLAMKSPFLRLGGAGDIDIGNSQLNYLAKASVVNTEAGQAGKDLDQLKGLTIPVRLSGPFSSPSYKIELGSLISDAAKAKVQAQVEEKKQEVKQKVEDAVKDKLKGLLGR